jgi:hypothetical protein
MLWSKKEICLRLPLGLLCYVRTMKIHKNRACFTFQRVRMILISTISLRRSPQLLSNAMSFILLTNVFLLNLCPKFHWRQHVQVLRTNSYSTRIFGWRESGVGKLILFDCRILMFLCPTERKFRDFVEFRPSGYSQYHTGMLSSHF